MIVLEGPHKTAIDALLAAGFESGWALTEGVLVLWEHDDEPPAPLTRPVAQQPAKTTK